MKTLRAIWLVLSRSARVSPGQTVICLLELLGSVFQVLQPMFLAWFVSGAVAGQLRPMITASIGFCAVISIAMILQLAGNNARINQREKVGFSFDTDIASMTAGIPTLDHLESAEYLDELQALHDQQSALGDALNMILNTMRNVVWAGGTIILASTADPRLLLLAVAGLPSLLTTKWSIGWQAKAEKTSAEPGRRTQHLFELGTRADGAAELRVFGLSGALHHRLGVAIRAWRGPFVSLGRRDGAVAAVNAAIFYSAAIAVLAWMLHDLITGQVTVAAMVLAVMLVGRLQSVGQTLEWSVRMLSRVVRTTNRFVWLRQYAGTVAKAHPGRQQPPARLRHGLRLENLSYRYAGAEAASIDGVNLDLPAGSVVALVGENGAGKSTLVKLLAGMYQPSDGRILVDGTDLREFDLEAWRARMSGAFQDYARFELTAQRSIGLGDLPSLDDRDRVELALRAGADDGVLPALPAGLDTRLGSTWPDGVDLSGGQWQRLAIARGMMRGDPLLLLLDEPTAALDAATENALFERYAEAARMAGGHGAVTILVTHRFSTVAAADLVVVLDRGRVAEVGTHTDLMTRGGHYAELYDLQARGYR